MAPFIHLIAVHRTYTYVHPLYMYIHHNTPNYNIKRGVNAFVQFDRRDEKMTHRGGGDGRGEMGIDGSTSDGACGWWC